ncbi:MAG TPA: hypothetical protein PLS24_07425, partial [Sedimentisphaerales bacterium]|nr:hypothetical protein [Sedimentisphaerales bacterium]
MTTRVRVLTCVLLLTSVGPAQAGMFSRLRGTKQQEQTKNSNETPAPAVQFQRQWEPRERAYSFLVPSGWIVEGGLFHVDPMQAGGSANSIDGKCDLAVKKDLAGTVM